VSPAIFAFEDDHAPAQRLADELQAPLHPVHLHRFPDGEALLTVAGGHDTALLYRGLDRPDDKVLPLRLAADALRRTGVKRLVLVAPYLPYLRQDKVFQPGQPLSRDVLGAVVGPGFDRIVTVEPHLHRTHDLRPVFGCPVTALSVAPLFAHAINGCGATLVVGPDAESEPWAAAVAQARGGDHAVFKKRRFGDADVALRLPDGLDVAGRKIVLVDDICSSGATLITATRELHARGAATIDVLVTHALFSPQTASTLRQAGVRRIVSTDSCRHPTNGIQLAGLLASALREEIAP
jgi:ribose-phosphate pyrophosphokinase